MRLIPARPSHPCRRRPGTASAHRPWHAAAAGLPGRVRRLALTSPALPWPGVVLAADSIRRVISNTTGWIVGILAGVATLFLTVGALRYLMAGGDPAEVERPRPR